MINEELKNLGLVRDDIRRYIKAQIEQILYKASAAITRSLASITYVCIGILLLLGLVLFSGITLGFGFSYWLNVPIWIGFLIVLGLYFFCLLLILMFKQQINNALRDIIASQIIQLIDDEREEYKTKDNPTNTVAKTPNTANE